MKIVKSPSAAPSVPSIHDIDTGECFCLPCDDEGVYIKTNENTHVNLVSGVQYDNDDCGEDERFYPVRCHLVLED